MILSVENSLARQASTLASMLSTNLTAGGTVVPVQNINGFTNQWAVQIGDTGEEIAEILVISGAPSGTALNTSGTIKYNHAKDTPIYQIHYDKVVFLRSTSGTSGTATALATVALTPDSYYTEYDDTSGAASYAYQVQYYNSVSGDLSGTSSWFTPGGPSFYSLQKLRDRSKKALFNANYIKDDETIDDWINEFVEQMTNKALKVDAYSMGTAQYAFGTAGLGTVTGSLFKFARKIEVTYDGSTYTPTTEILVNQFSENDTFTNLSPRHAWMGDTVFRILPSSTAGTARFTMGNIATRLTNDTDELPQFLKGYTTQCIEYCLYRAYDLDNKDQTADRHYKRYMEGMVDFTREITPRDKTGVRFIELDGDLSGREDEYDFFL